MLISFRIIELRPYGKSVDWWCFGVLLFELVTGQTPFKAQNTTPLFYSILETDLKIPDSFSPVFKDVCERLLKKNYKKRLNYQQMLTHQWFKDVNWTRILSQHEIPVFKFVPKNHIDTLFTSDIKRESDETVKLHKRCQYEDEFEDF